MILVLGEIGQIATELKYSGDILTLRRNLADFSDPVASVRVIHKSATCALINAAVYTAALRARGRGVCNNNHWNQTAIQQARADIQIPLVHISSDYVFDESGEVICKLADANVTKNAYGRS